MKMYRIKIKDNQNNQIFYRYGFSISIMDDLHYFFNETDNNFHHANTILEITVLAFSLKTFKKCLTKQSSMVKI